MESIKVYVHYEGSPEFTHVAKIIAGVSAEELASEFARVYNAKHGEKVSLDPATLHLLSGRRRIAKSTDLIRLVKDRSDIFVELDLSSSAGSDNYLLSSNGSEAKDHKEQNNTDLPQESILQEQSEFQKLEKTGPVSGNKRDSASDQDTAVVRSLVLYGLKNQQLKKYKVAGNTFQRVLKLKPNQKICLRALGSMALVARNYCGAVLWLNRGVVEYPKDFLFHARLGDAHSGLNNFKEALSEYDLALGLIGEFPEAYERVRTSSIGTRKSEGEETAWESQFRLLKLFDDPIAGDVLGPVTPEGLKISSAAVLRKMGEGELASALLKDAPLDSSEHQHRASGEIKLSLESIPSIPISKPLLSFGDDLLLQTLSSGMPRNAHRMDSIHIPAHLRHDNKKVNLVVFKSSDKNA